MSRTAPALTLESQIARYHVRRALRPYLRARRFVGVLVIPGADAVKPAEWEQAIYKLFKALYRLKNFADDLSTNFVLSEADAKEGLEGVKVIEARTLVLVGRDQADGFLAHASAAAADFVVRMPELDPRLVARAVREVHQIDLAEKDAEALSLARPKQRELICAGRSIPAALQRLAAAPKPASETVPAQPARRKTATRLEDLHGYGEAKTWGLELARDLADYRDGVIGWEDVDNGLLLSGPPGVGKTTLAAALAETCGVSLVTGSYARWQSEGHQGDMLKAMRLAFEVARKKAPCIMLIDEIDGFVDRESDSQNADYMRGVVNGLLEELDGSKSREGVVVIGACNNPGIVDPALRRPGRLDRHIELGLPDGPARIAILCRYLGRQLDLRPFTGRTEGMTGADLERAARDARRLARRQRVEVTHQHLSAVLPRLERRSQQELRLLAIHELGHAVVGAVLGSQRLTEVSLTMYRKPDVRSDVAAMATFDDIPGERRNADWFAAKVAVILGGIAAEHAFYASHTDGAGQDLVQASALATHTLSSLGMGDTLISDGNIDAEALAHARRFDRVLARRAEDLLQEQLVRARRVVEDHRDVIEELSGRLTRTMRLDGDVVYRAVERASAAQRSLAM
ncbi:AAA family ATPase [Pseudorhizobium flavum]|uniref:AAA family ATPase n=1 Tax=Pseudorhizobium flavum TaxID=1335061 RepID=UPI00249257CD|nr:AAA family ATPase [Pseudorhizobium flavum]